MDISGGLEAVPVILGECNSRKLPNFVYITDNIASTGCDEALFESILEGCECVATCGRSCSCLRQEVFDGTPFAVCGHLCSCTRTCPNRSVSDKPENGLPYRLEVFDVEDKGFGLRTLEPIARGRYVCTYVGEIIDEREARRREAARPAGRMNYIVCLREYSGQGVSPVLKTIVDPELYGGVGRFINHSCGPNLKPFLVRIGSALPTVCFYSARAIEAGEELTFDYGDGGSQADSANARRTECCCRSDQCRGWLPYELELF